jgi:methionyl-tRNA formyltransferase
MLGDTRLKLWPVRPCPPAGADNTPGVPGSLAPGELWAGRAGVFAGTAGRPVELGDVQPPGKRRMAAAEWARGLHLDRAGDGQPSPAFS